MDKDQCRFLPAHNTDIDLTGRVIRLHHLRLQTLAIVAVAPAKTNVGWLIGMTCLVLRFNSYILLYSAPPMHPSTSLPTRNWFRIGSRQKQVYVPSVNIPSGQSTRATTAGALLRLVLVGET